MSSTKAVANFLREHKPDFYIGNIAVYRKERILVVELEDKVIVFQAHTEKAFYNLLSNPENMIYIVEKTFSKEETLLPGDVSLMILYKEFVNNFEKQILVF